MITAIETVGSILLWFGYSGVAFWVGKTGYPRLLEESIKRQRARYPLTGGSDTEGATFLSIALGLLWLPLLPITVYVMWPQLRTLPRKLRKSYRVAKRVADLEREIWGKEEAQP